MQFYELKKEFKDINFISIQNGHRFENYSMFYNKKYMNTKLLKCDHIFVFNKYYVKEYNRIIDSKYHVLGNFKNNIVKLSKTQIYNEFLFISQFIQNHEKKNFQIKLLSLINLYLSRRKKKLHILLRGKNYLKQKEEIEFYEKIFKSNCIFHKTSKWKNSYKILDKFENIIFMFSTFGYEAIARKKKVAIFSPKRNNSFLLSFGWPGSYKNKFDFFSAKNLSYNEIKRVLSNIYSCSEANWKKKHYNNLKDHLYLDKNNSKLKRVIFKLLKK